MEEHRRIMKRVGWVLLIVGSVDVAAMIYCLLNHIPYGSSFNIFALIAALFLFRGSLRAARVIALFAGFMAAGFTGLLVNVPILVPWGLLRVLLRLHPFLVSFWVLFVVAAIALVTWVYRSLTSPPVRAAMEAAGVNLRRPWRRPAAGIVVGAAMAVSLAILLPLAFGGKTGQEAKARAAAQVGPGYQFYVDGFEESFVGGHKEVQATVTAYNDNEIRQIHVDWSE